MKARSGFYLCKEFDKFRFVEMFPPHRRFLSYDSCVASSRICQHVVARKAVKNTALRANVLLEPHRSIWQKLRLLQFSISPNRIWWGEGLTCTRLRFLAGRISVQWKWSLCPCFMCGPRSTSVLGLRILQSYVPLRAGRCESLPHMK